MSVDTVELRPSLSQRVAQRARTPRQSTVLLDVLIAPFWALGWAVFWMLVILGGITRWCSEAVVLGWLEARSSAQARGVAAHRWPVRAKTGWARHGPSQPGR